MTDDLNTKDLSDRELLELMRKDQMALLEHVEALDARIAILETRTNPLPPNYGERFAALEADMHAVKADLREVKTDLRQLRNRDWERGRELAEMQERVEVLEGYRAA